MFSENVSSLKVRSCYLRITFLAKTARVWEAYQGKK